MLYLASQSPRRRQLLEQIGVRFAILDVEVPEVRDPSETPEAYVGRVARAKATAGMACLGADSDAVVLAGDTEVVLGDEVFGKPVDAAHATAMLRRLAGRRHRVLSAVCCVGGQAATAAMNESIVEFASLSEERIAAYVASGEAFGRAAEPWEVADVIVFLASGYSSYMTGEIVSVSSQHP